MDDAHDQSVMLPRRCLLAKRACVPDRRCETNMTEYCPHATCGLAYRTILPIDERDLWYPRVHELLVTQNMISGHIGLNGAHAIPVHHHIKSTIGTITHNPVCLLYSTEVVLKNPRLSHMIVRHRFRMYLLFRIGYFLLSGASYEKAGQLGHSIRHAPGGAQPRKSTAGRRSIVALQLHMP